MHLFVSIPPQVTISRLVRRVKGKSSHTLLNEYSHLRKAFWGRHLWVLEALLRGRAGPAYVAADDIAAAYVGLGEADQAFEWLRQACEERATALMNLKVESSFDDLRPDRRFTDLLRYVGLA